MDERIVFCKKCERYLDRKYFYSKIVYLKGGRNKIGGLEKRVLIKPCKFCHGTKKSGERVAYPPNEKEKPLKKEINAFIKDMKSKSGYFDFIDCLRLIDIYTRQFGVVWTTMLPEDEMLLMWEKLKQLK